MHWSHVIHKYSISCIAARHSFRTNNTGGPSNQSVCWRTRDGTPMSDQPTKRRKRRARLTRALERFGAKPALPLVGELALENRPRNARNAPKSDSRYPASSRDAKKMPHLRWGCRSYRLSGLAGAPHWFIGLREISTGFASRRNIFRSGLLEHVFCFARPVRTVGMNRQ
jgi:hypothetical protein